MPEHCEADAAQRDAGERDAQGAVDIHGAMLVAGQRVVEARHEQQCNGYTDGESHRPVVLVISNRQPHRIALPGRGG